MCLQLIFKIKNIKIFIILSMTWHIYFLALFAKKTRASTSNKNPINACWNNFLSSILISIVLDSKMRVMQSEYFPCSVPALMDCREDRGTRLEELGISSARPMGNQQRFWADRSKNIVRGKCLVIGLFVILTTSTPDCIYNELISYWM